ncbi:DNA gyrase inhibitor YacG [Burkholderia plantarii]|uniref:DNA gyrase inhibitor YacG n=1 Tax=Burkholderia plantarii TaxID=41899 RepID=UPI0018DBC40D|nr:DNA gyrase inhibitor YacG [Burkholderia plantarii]MBI0326405.1 DNA gyrase inhibitor YacG [Burkholderia plantarii]
MTLVVKCPACAKDVSWTPESPFRPFCSARCKQMDLGAWAAERYRIGGTDDEPSDNAADGQPDGRSGRHD